MKLRKGIINTFMYEKDDVCVFKNKLFLNSKKVKKQFSHNFGMILNKDFDNFVLSKTNYHLIMDYTNNDLIRKHSPLYLHMINYISLSCKILLSKGFEEKEIPSFVYINCNEKTILKSNLDHINEGLNLKIMDIYERFYSDLDFEKLEEYPSYCFVEPKEDYKKILDTIYTKRDNLIYTYSVRPIFVFVNDLTDDIDILEYMEKGLERNIYFILCPKNFDEYIKSEKGKACFEQCKYMLSYENDKLNEAKIIYPEKVIYKKENHKG